MPYLYCERHGKEHEAETVSNQELYRQEGESVLIVSGPLKSGPWHCDSCNATLKRGMEACLLTPLPAWIMEQIEEYGFDQEKRYFAMKGEERVRLYGAEWQCRNVSRLLMREAEG